MHRQPAAEIVVRRLLQLGMAALATGAILVFWTAEAQACDVGDPPVESCEMVVEKQQMPGCLEVETDAVEQSSSCSFETSLTNDCDQNAELVFFCPDNFGGDCPDSRVLVPEESEPITLRSRRTTWDRTGETVEEQLGLRVQLFAQDESESGTEDKETNEDEEESDDGTSGPGGADEDGDSDDELQSGVSYRMEQTVVDAEFPDCSMGNPMGCTSNSSSNPSVPVSVIVALALIAVTTLLRPADETDTT